MHTHAVQYPTRCLARGSAHQRQTYLKAIYYEAAMSIFHRIVLRTQLIHCGEFACHFTFFNSN